MRVFAIQNIENGVCNSYGNGELIRGKIPNIEPFKSANLTNPCIKLESGKFVWGFECWWGKIEDKESNIKDCEIVIVEPENIQPI